jgi:hypothetical protein
MRTTLDIDEDVLAAAKQRTPRKRDCGEGPFLFRPTSTDRCNVFPRRDKRKSRLRFPPFPSRGGVVTNKAIDALRDEDAY